MSWVAAGMVGSAVVTSYGANKAARTANQGIEAQIAAQREALAAGQEASKFRPVGFTSPYGTATYDVDGDGNLTAVDFQLSQEMQERAATFSRLGNETLANISVDPTRVAQERTERMISLLDPSRSAQTESAYAQLAAKGLLGAGGDIGTGAYVNPIMTGLQESFAQQDRSIAAESYDFAQQDILDQLNLTRGLFKDEYGVYDIGRSELEYGRKLADEERARRLEGAGMQARASQNIGALTGDIANNNAQMIAAKYGQYGDIVNKGFGLLQEPAQQQNTKFRFYNSPTSTPQPGYEDPYLTQRWT
jgi:hypothetical protein